MISLTMKSWTQVSHQLCEDLLQRVEFDSDASPAVHKAYCLEEIKNRYKEHRDNLSRHFKSFTATDEARQHSSSDVLSAIWQELCTFYDSDAFKAKSVKNITNRQKQEYNHLAGTKFFVAHCAACEFTNEQGVIQPIDEIDLFKKIHQNETRWIVPTAQERYTVMVQLMEQQTSAETSAGQAVALSEVEVCSQILEPRYIQGLEKLTRLRVHTSTISLSAYQTLQTTVDDLRQQNQKRAHTFEELQWENAEMQRERTVMQRKRAKTTEWLRRLEELFLRGGRVSGSGGGS